jgi:hypothetical protein
VEDTQSALSAKNRKNYYEVYYEDLVRKPEKTMKDLFDFLEIPFEDSVLRHSSRSARDQDIKNFPSNPEAVKPIFDSKLSRWHKDLNYGEACEVEEKGGFLLRRLGYTKDSNWVNLLKK